MVGLDANIQAKNTNTAIAYYNEGFIAVRIRTPQCFNKNIDVYVAKLRRPRGTNQEKK